MKYTGLTLALLALAACDRAQTTEPMLHNATDPSVALDFRTDGNEAGAAGVVYTMSNQTAGNEVLAFARSADGSLAASGSFATGGTGTGGGLGSQNALATSRDGRFLFVVNPGNNTVSSFRIGTGGLQLVGAVPSGGVRPISLTAAFGLLYVLNDGGAGNIAGFRYDATGALTAIANSSRALSSGASAPAQIEFDAGGDRLVVTEKGTNMIATYRMMAGGLASNGVFTPSSGQTPFGFAFRRNVIVVSEAFGGAPNASVASTYRVTSNGSLAVISGSVPTTETAACWFVVTNSGQYAYTSNTGSGTITGYRVAGSGALTRLDDNGETAVIGAGTAPIDMALSRNSQYLYSLNSGNETISVLRVNANGSLSVAAGGVVGLPNGAVGLLAH